MIVGVREGLKAKIAKNVRMRVFELLSKIPIITIAFDCQPLTVYLVMCSCLENFKNGYLNYGKWPELLDELKYDVPVKIRRGRGRGFCWIAT